MPAARHEHEAHAAEWQALRNARARAADVHPGLERDQDLIAHMLHEYHGLWQHLERALEDRLQVLTDAARSAA